MADSSPSTPTPSSLAARIRNFIIVFVAVVLSASVFLGLQTQTGSTSLAAMAETSVPLEEALRSHKPTLMEFYADWCTSCQAMAGDMATLRDEYGDRINFVMLNVDNSKWLPEMLHYRVDGIPHFVFLSGDGEAIASSIGEQPRTVMAANLTALIDNDSLPYAQANRGQTSELKALTSPKASNSDPRSHGSQVVVN
jgi:thiol-disulfide isomerase/thioredoxin